MSRIGVVSEIAMFAVMTVPIAIWVGFVVYHIAQLVEPSGSVIYAVVYAIGVIAFAALGNSIAAWLIGQRSRFLSRRPWVVATTSALLFSAVTLAGAIDGSVDMLAGVLGHRRDDVLHGCLVVIWSVASTFVAAGVARISTAAGARYSGDA